MFRQIALCNGVLLEKLTAQLVNTFCLFCGTRRFIAASTTALRLSLSWASSIQSILFLKGLLNIVVPSTTRSSKRCLYLRFSHQSPIWTYALPDLSPMLRPSHSSWFGHQNDTAWGAQIMKLHIRHPPPVASYFVSLWHKSLLQHPNLITLSSALLQG